MKVLLVCSAGMSTSMLVEKMKTAAEARGLDAQISAIAESELQTNMDNGTSVVLVGPQIRYLENVIREKVEPHNIKCAVVDPFAYGMMLGDKVLDQALDLVKE